MDHYKNFTEADLTELGIDILTTALTYHALSELGTAPESYDGFARKILEMIQHELPHSWLTRDW